MRKVVGPDLLAAIGTSHLGSTDGATFLHLEVQATVHQACAKNFVRFCSVLQQVVSWRSRAGEGRERSGTHFVLRARVLHRDGDAGWDMGEADGGFGLVDVLRKESVQWLL